MSCLPFVCQRLFCEYLRIVFSDPCLQISRHYMEPSSDTRNFVRPSFLSTSCRVLIYCRVVELNIGTICASLPTLPAFYKHHRLKPSQIVTLKSFINKLNPFGSDCTVENGHLEIAILDSIKEEGKFLVPGDSTIITLSTEATRVSSNGFST